MLSGTPEAPVKVQTKGYYKVDSVQVAGLINRLQNQSGADFSWLDLQKGIERNIKYLSRRPENSVAAKYGRMQITWGMLKRTNEEMLELLPRLASSPELLNEKFVWHSMVPRTLLTGYYEPYLEASLTPHPDYPYPLYSIPSDLKTLDLGKFHHRWKGQQLIYRQDGEDVLPYHDREDIDFEGALQGRGFEIAWVKDLVDVFILQIQGSGRLVLPDGNVKHVLYAGKNGLKYVSLGKVLIQRGLLPKEGMSMQKIKAFLAANPQLVEELLTTNPSYVFFRLDDEGPFGSMGAPLTPMASVAVDSKVLPLGSLALLTTRLPQQGKKQKAPFARMVMAQDRGGAIKGTRVDLFCGSGPDAEYLAGHLTSWSHIYLPISRALLEEMEDAKTEQ
ncbi:murein transglycosylase A [Desulfovibrio sp. JC010]|uniref:murein transglycosylase A n=1 Tax=Desulfovibrio sp. JC010 TaxID=2593641 RepID=UPI001EF217B3|nr:MltA domain-containing protein [Desulfovibrio sp. JC010]